MAILFLYADPEKRTAYRIGCLTSGGFSIGPPIKKGFKAVYRLKQKL
jgi:hypothetical protein